MKFFVLLACLAVCYVSLPITTVATVEDQASAPSAVLPAVATVAVEEKPSDTSGGLQLVAAATAEAEKTADEKKPAEPAAAAQAAADAKPADKPADEKDKKEPEKKDDATAKKEDDAKKDEKDKKKKTATAKTKRLKVDVTLDGTFVADNMTQVILRPKEWTQFEIVDVVKHGAEVHKGQTLFKFDNEKILKEISDLELDLHLSELALRKADEELPRLEKTLQMNADDADRLNSNAKEDFEHYQKSDRPMMVQAVAYMVKMAQFMLDFEQDELTQLEKMYEADDLTEETEEIILKRQRASVDFATFNLEQAKQYRDEILDIRLPREDIRIKNAVDRAALDLARARLALSVDMGKARYELEQQKQARAKSLERHTKLIADRGLMELKSPADGIVYFGECEDGKWTDAASLVSKYEPKAAITANTVLMTIVSQRPLSVTAQVGEEKLADIKVGEDAKIVLPLEDSARLAAKVKSVSSIPVTDSKYSVEFTLGGDKLPDWVVAGTSCKVKINTSDKPDALVVPKKAVHADQYNDELQYVWIVDATKPEAKPERRDVKIGKRSGDDVEIANGLTAGDVVSLEDEDKDKDKDKDDE
jgi:HlyD family secretion protein